MESLSSRGLLMQPASFPCPHCATPLRVRDRHFVGQTIACPECQQSVTITSVGAELRGLATDARNLMDRDVTASRVTPARAGMIAAGLMTLVLLIWLAFPWPEPSGVRANSHAPPDAGTDTAVNLTVIGDAAVREAAVAEPRESGREAVPPSVSTPTSPAEGAARPDLPQARPAAVDSMPSPKLDVATHDAETVADTGSASGRDVSSGRSGSALEPSAARILQEVAQGADQPIDVLLAESMVTYDVERALSQRIQRFEQREPIPVRELLFVLEEMAAVPFHLDELPAALADQLSAPITLDLSETTVGQILDAIGNASGLTFDRRPDGLRIVQTTDASGAGAMPADDAD